MSDLMTLSQAGRTLELSTTQVRRLADSGRIEGIRTPLGRVVYRKSVEQLARVRKKQKGKRG